MSNRMSNVHICCLPSSTTTGLSKLPPNASCYKRLLRRLRELTIVNPENYRCKSIFFSNSLKKAEQKRHIKSPYFYIIHPFSNLGAFMEVCFVGLWLTLMIVLPITETMIVIDPNLEMLIGIALTPFQLFFVISFFFTGYVDPKIREVVIEQRSIVTNYLKTFFIFDLCATEIFQIVFMLIFSAISRTVHSDFIEYMHVPFLYVRLYTVLNYLDHIGEMIHINRTIRYGIYQIIKTFLYIHLFTCTMYWFPHMYYDDWPSDSWLVLAKIENRQKLWITAYIECFLMTSCYFFGASPGKYKVPQTNEQVVLSLIAFFGRIYTLFLLADILRMCGVVGISESGYERQLAQLRAYMGSNNLPQDLTRKLVIYYEHKLQKHYFNESEILGSLSSHLRTELFMFSARNLMKSSKVLKYIPQTELAAFISLMRLETFAPGDIILGIDSARDHVYFISTGTIAMLNRDGVELLHLEDGEIFGICGLSRIKEGKESYAAVAIETSDLFVIDYISFHEFLTSYPEVKEYLVKVSQGRQVLYRRAVDTTKKEMDSCTEELRKGLLLEKRRTRARK